MIGITEITVTKMFLSKNFVECIVDGKICNLDRSHLNWAIKEVERWQYGNTTNFTSKLFELLSKADNLNKRKIFMGFPEETIAYLMWYTKVGFGKRYNEDREFFESMDKVLNDESED